jgi:hypothetical protein
LDIPIILDRSDPVDEAHNVAMTSRTALASDEAKRVECWCCGTVGDRMVHLGNHPEVALCLRCAHWASKQAWELEDRERSGPLVAARDKLRSARRTVMQHGWQHNRIVGGPLRWLGKRLP